MSGDGPSGDGTDQGDADAADDAAEDLPRPTDEAYLAPAPQSALIGLMAEPVSRSVPIRRSTVLMVVAFLGFGALTLVYPPAPKAVTTITTTNPNGLIPGILPATTTTTHPAATTTTTTEPAPSTTTTSHPGTTTTTVGHPSTTTTSTRPSGSTTTTHPSTTTTVPARTSTTTPVTAAP